MENYSELISISSLILAVLAITLSIWQTTLAIKQTKKASEQTKDLIRHEENLIAIKQALSTRYLGQFPLYIDDIANLIDRGKQKIVLFFDMPGYGLFSSPSGWLKVKQAIERKISQNIDMSVILYSNEKRVQIMKEQYFHKGEEFTNWLNSSKVKEKAKQFLKKYGEKESYENLTPEELIKISEKAQMKILDETYVGVNVQEVDELTPIYFWMIDDNEAIFTIPAFTSDASEYGFYTSDKSLINALIGIKRRYSK